MPGQGASPWTGAGQERHDDVPRAEALGVLQGRHPARGADRQQVRSRPRGWITVPGPAVQIHQLVQASALRLSAPATGVARTGYRRRGKAQPETARVWRSARLTSPRPGGATISQTGSLGDLVKGWLSGSAGLLACRHLISDAGPVRRTGASGSILSVGSTGSILSIGSAGSILSVGSVGSILSVGSAGSIASIGSAASAASILSVCSVASRYAVLSGLSSFSVKAWRSAQAAVGGPSGPARPAGPARVAERMLGMPFAPAAAAAVAVVAAMLPIRAALPPARVLRTVPRQTS
jgi:hypothetical protein